MNRKWIYMTLLSVLIGSFAQSVQAGELKGVMMPDSVKVGDKTLLLNGMGLRLARVFGISVKVYVAGLYLSDKSTDALAVVSSNQPKRLVMQFVRPVDRKKLVDAWKKAVYKNCIADCNNYKKPLKQFNDMMVNVRKNNKITIDFFADRVEVMVEARELKTSVIASKPFSKNLLSVFIGKSPPNRELKKGLLGR